MLVFISHFLFLNFSSILSLVLSVLQWRGKRGLYTRDIKVLGWQWPLLPSTRLGSGRTESNFMERWLSFSYVELEVPMDKLKALGYPFVWKAVGGWSLGTKEPPLFINKYLFYLPGTELNSGDTEMNKTELLPSLISI